MNATSTDRPAAHRSTFYSAACSAFLLALLLASPSAHPRDARSLSAMDYVEIEQLVHRLHFALDYCTRGGQDFADLFVDDGQYIIDEGTGKPRILNTRDQLVHLAGGPDCSAIRTPPRAYVLHASENLVIEATPDGARGRSYAIYPASRGRYYADAFAGQVGLYFDEYVRTPKGWRFKTRRHAVAASVGDALPP